MESIETLNSRLIDYYGIDSDSSSPMFRIVWANDQVEKRLVEITEAGVTLLHPTIMDVKKYPYLKDFYVLERLVAVPDYNKPELLMLKLSYEPIWTYCNYQREPLPPIWRATKLIIDTLYAALGKLSLARYIEDEKERTPEGRDRRIQEIQDELFGNETETADALRYKEGIVVPSNYKKVN